MNNELLLEYRVLKLEKMLLNEDETQTRDRKKKPNIFSKDIDSIKAAIKSGTDINSVDRYGRTPLQVACASKVIDFNLIKYLLDNCANPNIKDKKGNSYVAVFIKNKQLDLLDIFLKYNVLPRNSGDNEDPRVRPLIASAILNGITDKSTLLSLIDDEVVTARSAIRNMISVIGEIESKYAWKILNEDVYAAIVSKYIAIMNKHGMIKDYFTSYDNGTDYYIYDEMSLRGTSYLFDAILKYNVWPFICCSESLQSIAKHHDVLEKIYESALRVTSSTYVYSIRGFIVDVLAARDVLNKPIDFLAKYLTPQIVASLNVERLYSVIYEAVKSNNVSLLRAIINGGKDTIKSGEVSHNITRNTIIRYVANHTTDEDITKLVLRMLNLMKDSDSIIITRDYWSIGKDLGMSHNRTLIEWFVDRGYGKDIENSVSSSEMSSEAKEALEGDESVARAADLRAEYDNKLNKQSRLSLAKNELESDRYVRYITAVTERFPEYLSDKDFYNMAKEMSSSSQLANRLVQYLDSLDSKNYNSAVYDM